MTKTSYRPRRAAAKYLEGAPEYVLSVHDFGEGLDRYTIRLGGSLLEPLLLRDRKVYAIAATGAGAYYWFEAQSNGNHGRLIAWKDLPEAVRNSAKFAAIYCPQNAPVGG